MLCTIHFESPVRRTRAHSIRTVLTVGALLFCVASDAGADIALMKTHCAKCHSGAEPKGDFDLQELKSSPDRQNIDLWVDSLEYVKAGEMPPDDESRVSDQDRERLILFLGKQVSVYDHGSNRSLRIAPRRLNNRELANSLRDVLMIEDVGTHQPLSMLLGDTLQEGFDTQGDALGFSEYHLDQYITAIRKVIDATILSGERPETKVYDVPSDRLVISDMSNRARASRDNRTDTSIELLDLKHFAYLQNFTQVPTTGRYRIRIQAVAVDRHVYESQETGVYAGDPMKLRVHMGDRVRDFELAEGKPQDLVLDEWLAAGSTLRMSYLTDGLRLKGNGNFKFQFRIAHDHIQKNNPKLYQHVVNHEVPRARRRSDSPEHWVHWTDYWQGPRPRLFNATVEGPIYEAWPPLRQQALLGANPTASKAADILRPIAQRAWRREDVDAELAPIAKLVAAQADSLGNVEALKEGILATLLSPSFLLINADGTSDSERFATKLSYLLNSSTPDNELRRSASDGKLRSFDTVLGEIKRRIERGGADEFLREFPSAWLQLDRINFMAPDPERYRFFERKNVSQDMVDEALAFFRHVVAENRPVTELLTADYSFVNADLAAIYQLDDVAEDSVLRKYKFTDGRRGGFLGMGAFLTLTADSLGTSPIHRAVYVMENFMGIHPAPPPADVNITEPDVRSATTIREVLAAHQSDKACAACHQAIDPFGYAFENFDPVGAWRDRYDPVAFVPQTNEASTNREPIKQRNVTDRSGIRIDASATFRNGAQYKDIVQFREMMKTKANQDRFVRCFITKLLTYANGIEPDDYTAVQEILRESAQHNHRIVETIAAVVNSPLFRETRAESATRPSRL